MKKISIITPVYNEQDNVPEFARQLFEVLDTLPWEFEIIAVNDGSTDGSFERLQAEAESRPELKVLDLRRNVGQTAAIMAGIDHSTGDILIPMDADLQNDPRDIPVLLKRLEEGYDVVSGWRRDRKDEAIRRVIPSRIANKIVSWVSGVRLHDYGCTLKAYRRDVLEGVRLYGEMHRFIPVFASWLGASVTEVPVRHHPRIHGTSNYGLSRVIKVLLDILVIRFQDRYFTKPIYVFGGIGLLAMAVSALFFVYMLYLKIFEGSAMISTPLPILVATTFMTGVLSILMGLLAEVVVRTYFESQQKTTYYVRRSVNLE